MDFLRSLGDWLEDRTGVCSQLAALRDLPVKRYSGWSGLLRGGLLALILFEGITGALLACSYTASADFAHASVLRIIEETILGGLLRSIHCHGTNFLVVLIILAGLTQVIRRGYSQPREVQWVAGIFLGAVLLVTATTGYLLPWDQYGYWGTQVRTSIMGSAPVIGDEVKTVVLGGKTIGNLSLTRFYAGHSLILPGVAVVLLMLYLGAWKRCARREAIAEPQTVPYWPGQAWRDLVGGLAVILAVFAASLWFPVHLGAQADPLETYPARPEWYFFWLFQLLKFFQGPAEVVGTLVIPHTLAILVIAIPFMDRSATGNGPGRKFVLAFTGLFLAGCVSLTAVALYGDYRSGHFEEVALWEATADPDFDTDAFYKQKCNKCHGRDGAGMLDTTPDFTSETYWRGVRSDVRLLKAILKGMPNHKIPAEDQMPGFAEEVTAGQAKALVERKIRRFK